MELRILKSQNSSKNLSFWRNFSASSNQASTSRSTTTQPSINKSSDGTGSELRDVSKEKLEGKILK